MKAITVKQPWASLICTPRKEDPAKGIKDIENRTWKCPSKYIGKRILIHSSGKSVNIGLYFNAPFTRAQWAEMNIDENFRNKCNGNTLKFLPKSVIIGSVKIVDCVINHPSIWADETKKIHPPIYNWVLADPILFPEPIPAKGKLSFWNFELP